MKIDGRRVLVDVERSRTVKGWLPRRLGKFLKHLLKPLPRYLSLEMGKWPGTSFHNYWFLSRSQIKHMFKYIYYLRKWTRAYFHIFFSNEAVYAVNFGQDQPIKAVCQFEGLLVFGTVRVHKAGLHEKRLCDFVFCRSGRAVPSSMVSKARHW